MAGRPGAAPRAARPRRSTRLQCWVPRSSHDVYSRPGLPVSGRGEHLASRKLPRIRRERCAHPQGIVRVCRVWRASGGCRARPEGLARTTGARATSQADLTDRRARPPAQSEITR